MSKGAQRSRFLTLESLAWRFIRRAVPGLSRTHLPCSVSGAVLDFLRSRLIWARS